MKEKTLIQLKKLTTTKRLKMQCFNVWICYLCYRSERIGSNNKNKKNTQSENYYYKQMLIWHEEN